MCTVWNVINSKQQQPQVKTTANKQRHTHMHTLPPFSQQQGIAQGGIWFKLENQPKGLVLYFLRQMVLFCNEPWISSPLHYWHFSWIILCCGCCRCIAGCWAVSTAFTHQMPGIITPNLPPPPALWQTKNISKYCQMSPGGGDGGQKWPRLVTTNLSWEYMNQLGEI